MVSSVYIHIPFCSKICTYCNFSKVHYNTIIVDKYLISLEEEIKARYKGETIKTIYIGGGTPSSLNLKQLHKLFSIISIFKLDKNPSITIELNPNDIIDEKIKLLTKYKVNRVSIGIQSFNKKILTLLGRTHTYSDVKKAINLLHSYNINDINLDLIYGINTQTIKALKEDINLFLKLDITHIATYSLILEESTILYNNNYQVIDEDIEYDMYKYINKTLTSKGFNHYEISNYAKVGYESIHNLVYWSNKEYYGFGVGSASNIGNKRYTCINNIRKYIDKIYKYEEEIITLKKCEEYEYILGLRKIKGINIEEFILKFNKSPLDNDVIKNLIKENKLLLENNNLFINPKYIYISNEILLDIIN